MSICVLFWGDMIMEVFNLVVGFRKLICVGVDVVKIVRRIFLGFWGVVRIL